MSKEKPKEKIVNNLPATAYNPWEDDGYPAKVLVHDPGSWIDDDVAERITGDKLGTLEQKLDGLEMNAREAGDLFDRTRHKKWLLGKIPTARDEHIDKFGYGHKSAKLMTEANTRAPVWTPPNFPAPRPVTQFDPVVEEHGMSFEDCYKEAKVEMAMRDSTMSRLAAQMGVAPPFVAVSYSIVVAQPWYRAIIKKLVKFLERL